ncbi:MAG: hydroxyacid dehydrogenase [Candidatus Bathyarchaeia archaeon]
MIEMAKRADKPKVLATFHSPLLSEDMMKKLSEVAVVQFASEEAPTEQDVITGIGDADVLLVTSRRPTISGRIIQAGKRLKAVVVPSVGFDQIDVEAATELGVLVVNTPSADDVVAEQTILLMLAVAKQFPRLVEAAKEGVRVPTWKENVELFGKTLGIIGLGRIGSRVAQIANAMGMSVIAYDPFVSERHARLLKTRLVDLKTLLRESDFVSIHTPLTKETYHIIGEGELNLMKKTAFIINTARGKCIDEKALYVALRERRIAGAGLDVFEVEPLRPDNPLLALDNVVATAHSLSGSIERTQRIQQMVLDSILRTLRGALPRHIVNPQVLDAVIGGQG